LFGEVLQKEPKPSVNDIPFRHNKETMSVEHYYDSGYVIKRTRRPNSLELIKEGTNLTKYEDEDKTKPDTKETQKIINNLLGMDLDTFVKTSIFDKQSIQFLINGSETKKKQFIERIFNIQSTDEYLAKTKELEKKTIKKIDIKENTLKIANDELFSIVERKEKNLERIEEFDSEKIIELDQIKTQIKVVKKELETLLEKDIKGEREKLKEKQEHEKVVSKLSLEKSNLYNKIIEKKTDYEKYKEYKNVDIAVLEKNIKDNEKISKKINALEKQKNDETGYDLLEQKNKFEKNEIVLQTLYEKFKLYEKVDVEGLKKTAKQNKEYEATIEKLEKVKNKVNVDVQVLENSLNDLKKSKTDSVCPTCEQKIDESAIDKKITNKTAELKKQKVLLEKVDNKVLTLKEKVVVIEHDVDVVEKAKTFDIKEYNNIKAEIIKIETKEVLLENIHKQIVDLENCAETIGYDVDAVKTSRKFDIENYTKELKTFKGLKEKREKLSEKTFDCMDEEDILETEKAISVKETNIAGLNEKHEEKKESKNPYLELLEDIKKEISDKKVQVESVKKEVLDKRSSLSYIKYWKTAFDKKGIKTLMLNNAIEIINTKINKYVEMFDGNEVSFDSDIKETGDYSTQSAGEKQRTNLALLFSCFEVCLAQSSIGILAVDEALDGMDISGIKSLLGALKYISRQIGTVLFVSHSELFNNNEIIQNGKIVANKYLDFFDDTITVVKKNDRSLIV